MMTIDQAALDADAAALTAHIESIQAPHSAAFRQPPPAAYAEGAAVWIWDHHNTGTIVGPGTRPGTWRIAAPDADGRSSQHVYPTAQLRPALAPMVFRWATGQLDPDAQCPDHGSARWRCDEIH